jgi:hypothetical protein
MFAASRYRGLALRAWLVGAILWGGLAVAQGAEPPEEAAIGAHVAAGEFGPAVAAAKELRDAVARDRWFREISLAQQRSGARSAAAETLAYVGDDRVRAATIGEFRSARGGAAMADFDSLIDLVTSTVHPESWKETGTGEGTIAPFPTGVYVDAAGLLKKRTIAARHDLEELRAEALAANGNRDVMQTSGLRKVSLNRLEREAQLRYAQGLAPTEAMQNLAGITRIRYLLFYPETGDLVIAGPAGAWRENAEGRMVSADRGLPVAQLDDLVVALRNAFAQEPKFGCAITPREENLAKTKAFVVESSRQPLKPGGRDAWLKTLRETLGRQDITVFGIDPRTHAAHILVEADYHMKLIGMGLEEATPGVKSYLDTVEVGPNGELPPMDVLRWWFTLNYDAVEATKTGDAFALKGPGVKVLSENEMLTERGERVHTGKSDELNSRFAQGFTRHFEALATKYPVYAELRNIFDLALVAGIIRGEDLAGQVGWHQTHFGAEGAYQPRLDHAPTEVDTIINHRVIAGKHIVAGISGGVSVDTSPLVRRGAMNVDDYGALTAERANSQPRPAIHRAWWWD